MSTGRPLRSSGGGGNVDLDLLELTDGRLYTLQCRSACCTRQADKCMGEGLLNNRDHTALRAISICAPHKNCKVQ
jgi:hypothetical protein